MTTLNVVNTMDTYWNSVTGDFGGNAQVTQVECGGYSSENFVHNPGTEVEAVAFAHRHVWKVRASDEFIEESGGEGEASYTIRVRWKSQAVASAGLDFSESYFEERKADLPALCTNLFDSRATSPGTSYAEASGTSAGNPPARYAYAREEDYQGGESDEDGDIDNPPTPPFVNVSNAQWTYQGINITGYCVFEYVKGEWIALIEFDDLSPQMTCNLGASVTSQETGFAGAGGYLRKQFRLIDVGGQSFPDW